jgi:hypothetical protein
VFEEFETQFMTKYIRYLFIILYFIFPVWIWGTTMDTAKLSSRNILVQASIDINGVTNFSGSLQLKVGIYTFDKDSDPLWSETFKAIKVTNGVFTQKLGTAKNPLFGIIFLDDDLRIGITPYENNQPLDTQFIDLSAVPYAFHSEYSKTAERLADEQILKFNLDKKFVGINNLSPAYTLDVGGTVNATAFIGDGSGLTNVTISGDVKRTWKHASNSNNIYFSDGFVGINTQTPQSQLGVNGNMIVSGNLIVSGNITAKLLSGDGSLIKNINANAISHGTLSNQRLSGAYPHISGLGTILTGTWNATPISDAFISDSLTLENSRLIGTNIISGNILLVGPTTITGDVLSIDTPLWKLSDNGQLSLKSMIIQDSFSAKKLWITRNTIEVLSNDGLHIHPSGGTLDSGLFFSNNGFVGIGTKSPQSTLDINGGLRIGNTTSEQEGTIRYNTTAQRFEGFSKQPDQITATWNQLDYTSDLDPNALHSEDHTIKNLIYIKSNGNIGLGGIPSDNITDDIVLSGNVVMTAASSPTDLAISGPGARMMWVPAKAAFRAGVVSGDQWDYTNIGQNSVVFGHSGKADADNTIILGGKNNTVSAKGSVVVGGYSNTILNAQYSVIVGGGTDGGYGNTINSSGEYNTIVGGHSNTIGSTASNATIIGGSNNSVDAAYGIALGKNINIAHTNTFIYSNKDSIVSSTADNQFLIYADGGVGIGTTPSTNIALHVGGPVYASNYTGDGSQLSYVDAYTLNGKFAQTTKTADSIYVSDALGFLPTGSVNSDSIQDKSITGLDIADNTITSRDIQNYSITHLKIAPNAITSEKITSGAVTHIKIKPYAITSYNIRDGGIASKNIAHLSIQQHHIAFGAITNAKIATNTITSDRIVDNTITSKDIQVGAISSHNIAEDAIQSHHMANQSISSNNIRAQSIYTKHLTDFLIKSQHISNNAIIANHISPNAILEEHISDYAIQAIHITSNAITSQNIALGVISSDKIAPKAILSKHITPNAILSDHITPNAILAHHISPNAIINSHIQENAITSSNILDGSISHNDIAFNAITSRNISPHTITGDQIKIAGLPGSLLLPNTITSKNISLGGIASHNIATNAIASNNIAPSAIQSIHIKDHTISSDLIAIGTITTELIASKAIQAHHISPNAITSPNFSTNSIPWSKITSTPLPSEKIEDGSITGSKIAENTITSKNIQAKSIFSHHIADAAIKSHHLDGEVPVDKGGIGDMLSNPATLADGGIMFVDKSNPLSPNLKADANFTWKNNGLGIGLNGGDPLAPLHVSGNVIIKKGSLQFDNHNAIAYSNAEWSNTNSATGFMIFGTIPPPITTSSEPTSGLKASTVYVKDKLGVGILDPTNTLDVSGNMSIGYKNEPAPDNGLIVKGPVGIGVSNPNYSLHVSGNIMTQGIIAEHSSGIGIQTWGGATGIIATGNNTGIDVTAKQIGIQVTSSLNGIVVDVQNPDSGSIGIKATIEPNIEGSLAKTHTSDFYSVYGKAPISDNHYAGYFEGLVQVSGNMQVGNSPFDSTHSNTELYIKGDAFFDGVVYATENAEVDSDEIKFNTSNKQFLQNCTENKTINLPHFPQNGSYFLTLRVASIGASCVVGFSEEGANVIIKWKGGTIPTGPGAIGTYIYSFYTYSNGTTTTYYGLPKKEFN